MSKKSKSSTVSKPWEPVQDDILGAVGTVRDVVGRNQGNLEGIAGDIRGFLPGLGERAFGPNPLLEGGNQYAMDVLGGRYLNSNPHLEGMIDATSDDVMDRVNSLFGRSGASLGTRHAGVLTSELAQAQNAMRYGNYAQERQNQQGAAGMIPGLNASQYAGIAPFLAASQTAGTLPYAGLGALSPIIGLAGGSGSSSGSQSPSTLQMLLNAAASAAAAASDRRLKDNIEMVGRLDNGLGVYEWEYRHDKGIDLPEGRFRGVMADEVSRIMPWMLGAPIGGYMTVRYTPERVG